MSLAPMSLALDKRQRAMLREMGVRVWQPHQPVVALADAPDLIAAPAREDWAGGAFGIKNAAGATSSISATSAFSADASAAPPAPPAQVPAPTARAPVPGAPTRPVPASPMPGVAAGWQLGDAQTVHLGAGPAPAEASGPRWLLLVETPAASLRAGALDPLADDAGKLLANMLRAARLDRSEKALHPSPAGAVLLAPLARIAAAGAAADGLNDALAGLIAHARPDIVLVMGRLASQALLQSTEPLGKLRGRVHRLHGVRTVITYDAAYLLRSPLEKAKAWEDLCLAIGQSQRPT